MKIKKPISLSIISFSLFLAAAIYITYPLIFHLTDRVTGYGDELVIAWIQNWVIHALTTNPLSLFEANIYYPYHNTLAFSETFIFTSIIAMPIRLITGEPISTVNFTLISSLVFLGFSLYLLCFYLTKKFWASLFSGMMVIFSPAVLGYAIPLQLLSIECVPLSILCFLHFLKTQKSLFLGLCFIFFILQMYNSIMPGYFIVFSLFIIFIFQWFENKKQIGHLFTKKNLLLVLFTIVLIVPIALPYYQVSKEFNYVRDIRDTIHFALEPEDLFYPGETTKLKQLLLELPSNQHSQNDEFKPGYLGVIFSLLIIFVCVYLFKKRKKTTSYEKSFLTIAALGFILSLGPFLHLGRQTIHHPFPIPLPYFVFYYLIPGFQGIRNSQRWEMLFILSMAIVIGLVLSQVTVQWGKSKKVLFYLVLFFGVFAEFYPIQFVPITQRKNFPEIYSWMATMPQNARFIELPIYNWDSTPYVGQEIFREYYGTDNFRRIVNGYSGFSPPPWQDFIVATYQQFPNEQSIERIRQMGVQYIIISTKDFDNGYKNKYEKYSGKQIVKTLDKNKSVSLIKKLDSYYVFAITVKSSFNPPH